jgi:ribonuclease R
LNRTARLVEATVEMKQGGFAFGTEIGQAKRTSKAIKDPYISGARLHSALHGDRVLLRLDRERRNGRSEAEVIQVLERHSGRITGFYVSGKKSGTVYPEDRKFPFDITITSPPEPEIRDGDAVVVKLLEGTGKHGRWEGEIAEVIGDPNDFDVQVRLVTEKFELPVTFSDKAMQEAAEARPEPGPGEREDLRDIFHVTIDGEDAKDYDDAIGVLKNDGGYRLYVSIADVSAYVKTGSELDREAYARGTSIYLPGTVIPMLPEKLSNDLCSLLPETDRLALTAILDFDKNGQPGTARFTRSVIRSSQRFTYDTVNQIVVDKNPEVRAAFASFVGPLEWARELAEILSARRLSRGSINFRISEAAFAFDGDKQVRSITKAQRHFSHQMIEEFMLAANEAVARKLSEAQRPLLYRIHELPDREKIASFTSFSATLGLDLPENSATPGWYNELIANVEGTPREYIVNNLLLRTMQQARYNPENAGHFGLAAPLYCHFTSPIRRYPDLIVHRLLCQLGEAATGVPRESKEVPVSPANSLKEDGRHLSERERIAISSERDMAERLKQQFMSSRVGEQFEAVISGVNSRFIYIELLDFPVSGSVPLANLTDDYYILDEKKHRFVGDISGRVLQVGDLVESRLSDVDRYQGRMYFTLSQPD